MIMLHATEKGVPIHDNVFETIYLRDKSEIEAETLGSQRKSFRISPTAVSNANDGSEASTPQKRLPYYLK